VLIDGVPVQRSVSATGGFDFSAFDLADIARVEVLSGPQGSLWGSDAIGGVISFTTRELDGLRGELEAGSFGTVRGSAAAGRATEAYAVGLSLSGLSTDGISKAENGTEDDGFETRTATVNGRYDVSERVTLDGRVRYNGSEAEIDGYDANFAFGDTDEVYETETVSGFGRVRVADALGFDHAVSVSLFETERSVGGAAFPVQLRRRSPACNATRLSGPSRARVRAGRRAGARGQTAATLSDGSEADLGATVGLRGAAA
jgi:vitamin B12 transporter